MKLPTYLYRATTSIYLSPLGLRGTKHGRIYFSEYPEYLSGYAHIQREMIGRGHPILVTIKVDSELAKNLRQGREEEGEWYVVGGFVPRRNIIKITRLLPPRKDIQRALRDYLKGAAEA